MTVKGTEILNKLIGAGCLFASVAFFSDSGHTLPFMMPGLLFGASGLWLVIRRERRPAVELDLQQRVGELGEGLAATRAELAATQERLERITEEQDFMRQLGGRLATPRPAAARPLEVPAPARAPELTPPG